MKPPPFSYSAPTTVPEAVALLVEHADEETGGQSLVPLNVAVNDALAPFGVRVTELPMTPDRLRAAIRAAGAAAPDR